MADPILDNGTHALTFARGLTEKLIEGLSEAQWLFKPHGQANNALWNVGHIAISDAYFLMRIGGPDSAIIEDWKGHFGPGSTCSDRLADYPPIDRVLKEFRDQRKAVIEWYAARTPAQLAEPMPEGLEFFAPNKGLFMPVLAWHEGLHAGQISSARRAQGMSPAIG
ncbi:MAG: DinB family protein [Phycisphaeraceae bacterium]|nr:DinB family protein [Phycisphaeraceae bacterium]